MLNFFDWKSKSKTKLNKFAFSTEELGKLDKRKR